jgi:L-phenylalanine/L-methionine N-acetyltransferase
MPIKIRAAEPADYAALCETMAQPVAQANTLQLPFPSLEMWKTRLAEWPKSDHLLVAELEDKVIGHLGLHPVNKSPRMRHVCALGMAVHDAYTRRGVGTALVEAGLNLADNWLQATRIELSVYTSNNPAITLYQKFGFTIEGTMRHYAFRNGQYADAHLMARITDKGSA